MKQNWSMQMKYTHYDVDKFLNLNYLRAKNQNMIKDEWWPTSWTLLIVNVKVGKPKVCVFNYITFNHITIVRS